MSEHKIRAAQPDDFRFIITTWLKSWRNSPWSGCIRNDEFYTVQRSTIEGLVGRGAEFSVAESHSGRLLGWICYEVADSGESIVHYLYVKDAYIPLGIGAALVRGCPGNKPGFYTHRFRQVTEACPGWRHAPEIARRKSNGRATKGRLFPGADQST